MVQPLPAAGAHNWHTALNAVLTELQNGMDPGARILPEVTGDLNEARDGTGWAYAGNVTAHYPPTTETITLETWSLASGYQFQRATSWDGHAFVRYATPPGPGWGAWVPLSGRHAEIYAPAGIPLNPGYSMSPNDYVYAARVDGMVTLSCRLTIAPNPPSPTAFTLPLGYRPLTNTWCAPAMGSSEVRIADYGALDCWGAASPLTFTMTYPTTNPWPA